MVAQLLIERVELLARGGADYEGDAQVAPLAARAQLDARRIEVGRVLVDDVHHRLREPGLLAAHHLDGEIAGESERRSLGHYADSASRLPARITLRLNSWESSCMRR